MLIPGRLGRTTLGDVLGGLLRLEVTGTLELCELPPSSRRHLIELTEGRVSSVRSDVGASLAVLLGDGTFQASVPGRTAAELWVEGGVPKQVVQSALDKQRRARLEYLFALPDARLAFHPRAVQSGAGLPLPELGPREVLSGRRRYAERPSGESPSRSKRLETLGLPPDATLEDVRRAFREIARSLHPDQLGGVEREERERLARRFAQISAVYHELVG
jgi:DnaJ domain